MSNKLSGLLGNNLADVAIAGKSLTYPGGINADLNCWLMPCQNISFKMCRDIHNKGEATGIERLVNVTECDVFRG